MRFSRQTDHKHISSCSSHPRNSHSHPRTWNPRTSHPRPSHPRPSHPRPSHPRPSHSHRPAKQHATNTNDRTRESSAARRTNAAAPVLVPVLVLPRVVRIPGSLLGGVLTPHHASIQLAPPDSKQQRKVKCLLPPFAITVGLPEKTTRTE